MTGPLYRSRALKAMESHEDIERLLPVTSWRSWLAAAAGLLLVVAAVLLIRFRVNSTWLILGGAAVGLVLSAVQRTF